MRKSIKRKNFKSCRFPLIRKSAEVLILEGLREVPGCVGDELPAGEGVLRGEQWHGQGAGSYLLRAEKQNHYNAAYIDSQYELVVFRMG